MIMTQAIRAADWQTTPFPWTSIDEVLPRNTLNDLIDAFPLDDFAGDESSPNHQRSQLMRTLALRSATELLQRDEALPDCWNGLIDDLLDPEYAAVMSEAAEVDLSRSGMTIAIWRMPTGGFNATHGTSRDKIISQLIYFSPEWSADWGGDFQIRADDHDHTLVHSLTPFPGTSVAFRATPKSWHCAMAASDRRSDRRRRRARRRDRERDDPGTWGGDSRRSHRRCGRLPC